nr:Equilibrative nucleoside transporter 1 [Hymenolepis microstoma]
MIEETSVVSKTTKPLDVEAYQLRNQSLPADVDPLLPLHRTELQKVFSTYLTISSMVPATLGNFLNLVIKDWLPVYPRLIGSSAIMLAIFITTTAFTKIAIDTRIFFTLTLTTVAVNNVGAINQGSTYGILSILPGGNVQGFLEGQAVAGIGAAVANIIAIAAASSPKGVGFAYFLIAVGIIALTIFLFIVLFKNPYFQYYWSRRNVAAHDNTSLVGKIKNTFSNLYLAMHDVKWTGITTFFIFTCTLSTFPSISILLVPKNFDAGSVWHTKYFHAVVVFLNFNISDYIGRMLVAWFKWPRFEQRRILMLLVMARFFLVPLALFCNINSDKIPTLFYQDSIPTQTIS